MNLISIDWKCDILNKLKIMIMIYFNEKYEYDSIAKIYWSKIIEYIDSVSIMKMFYKTCQDLLTSIFRAKNVDKQCDKFYFNLIVQVDMIELLMKFDIYLFLFSIFHLINKVIKEANQKNKKNWWSSQLIHQIYLWKI